MASEKQYLIAFLLDHCSPKVFFDDLIDSGEAPHISKYILGTKNTQGTYDNATISRHSTAAFPSSSANSHPSLLTGSYGGKNSHFNGFLWKLNGDFPEYINTDRLALSTLYRYPREFINPACKTLFEHIPGSASYYVLDRGAKFKLFTLGRILKDFVPFFISMNNDKTPGAVQPIARPEIWRNLFGKYMPLMLEQAKRGEMAPASYITLLLTDQFAHRFGFGKRYREAVVAVLDYCVALLVEGYDDPKKGHIAGFKELGILDQINWVIFSDHAGRPIPQDKYIMLDTVLAGECGLRIIEGENQWNDILRLKKDIKVLNGDKKKAIGKINMFSAFGSEDQMYWAAPNKAEGLLPKDFTGFYGENLFRNMIPNDENFPNRPDHVDLIAYLINKPWTQFVLVPEEDPVVLTPKKLDLDVRVQMPIPRTYQIKIFAKNGTGIVNRKFENGEKYYHYQILDGSDPLDYNQVNWDYKRWYSSEETLQLTVNHELPDTLNRLFGMFDAPLAPNLVVTSSYEYHFWASKTMHENEIRYIQTHGGLFKEESIIPTTFAGPAFNKGVEIPYARNVDILPTMLEAMGVQYDANRLDGKPIKAALKKK